MSKRTEYLNRNSKGEIIDEELEKWLEGNIPLVAPVTAEHRRVCVKPVCDNVRERELSKLIPGVLSKKAEKKRSMPG